MPLDRIDSQIVAALQKDARLSNKELAAMVGLAPSSCHTRVRRLTDSGVFRSFCTEIDPARAGVGLETLVQIRLTDHGEKHGRKTVQFLESCPEVVEIFLIAGQVDLVLHVAVRDTQHLRKLVLDTIATRPEVADVDTRLVYERIGGRGYPLLD